MNTLLTGRAFHGAALCCIQSANSALPWGSSTTIPSMPAVLRPALTSVTRRTLMSVLERERSINFCRLRTRLRSPACDAVKILCLSRRTSPSAACQSIDNQSVGSPSGPFTAARWTTAESAAAIGVAMVSNLSFGSSVEVIGSSQAHLIHVSTLSGPGSCPYPASCSGRPAEAPATSPGFLLPFGRRRWLLGSSCSRWGVGPSLRSAYRRRCLRTPSGLPRSTRARCDRVGCPLYSGTAMLSRLVRNPQPAPAASQRPVLHPAGTSHLRSRKSRSIIGGSLAFTRPVFPLPVACGWNAGPWASPPSSAPSRYRQRTSGWGLALSTGQELRCRPQSSGL
ncbi:hypothetical protein P3T34_007831 [Kitasatospora sp. MAP12-44]|nr:hypothetical protein [Kitasatospora sp. MAP12-44]